MATIPRPQLTIAQLLQVSTATQGVRLTPITIGTQYRLNRYGIDANTPGYALDSAGMNIPYEYRDDSGAVVPLPASNTVDTAYTRLYAEDVEASLATFSTGFQLVDINTPNVLRLTGGDTVGGAGLATPFRDRPVAINDLVYVTDTDNTIRRRRVTGLRGVTVASSIGTNSTNDDERAANSTFNPVDGVSAAFTPLAAPSGMSIALASGSVAGDYDALVNGATRIGSQYGDEFTLTVSADGAPGVATVNITSRSGLYSASNVPTVNTAGDYEVSHAALCGLKILLEDGGAGTLLTGQVFRFRIVGDYDRLDTSNATKANRHLQIDGTYTGPVGSNTTYLIQVITGTAAGSNSATGAVIRVSDTAGLEVPFDHTITEGVSFPLGSYGLTATFEIDANSAPPAQGGLLAGDVYYINAVATRESTTTFDKIVLDGPAVDTSITGTGVDLKTEFRIPYSGIITRDAAPGGTAWTSNATDITINPSLAMFVAARSAPYQWVTFADGVGKLFPYYRAAVPASPLENKIEITSDDDIIRNFGPITLDNDLAYGASRMLRGGNGVSGYALRTSGPGVDNLNAALRKIESTRGVYALAVLVDSAEEKQAVANHVLAMSTKEEKKFRRAYVGIDSPGEYTVLSEQEDGTPYTATVTTYAGSNVLVTAAQSSAGFDLLGLTKGDLFHLVNDNVSYEIAEVISGTELLLVNGPTVPVSPAAPFTIIRADTAESQADYLKKAAQAIGTRRVCQIWCENGTTTENGVTRVVPNKFVACEVAGLRCALLPQQGLTRTEILTIQDAPAMYTRYTQAQLDDIANAGTFIITQDAESGAVYIRMQLTTETDKGSLYYEDNVGVIIDDISFDIDDAYEPYIGRRNVVPRTLQALKDRQFEILMERTTTDADTESLDIGPALLAFEDLVVEVVPNVKDRVRTRVRLIIPLPLNNIDVELEAEATVVLADTTTATGAATAGLAQ